jgi:hypothetical protein
MFAHWERIRSAVLASIAVGWLASVAQAQGQHLTAREVVARIQQQVGVPWQSDTVDTFKAGNPDSPVSGIAVTMMATLDVLQRAAAAGDNLVITHEPTFFDHLDIPDQLPEKDDDSVLMAKRKFIAEHGLVVWRFHDHWHARNPDGIGGGPCFGMGEVSGCAQSIFVHDFGDSPGKAGGGYQAQAWNRRRQSGRGSELTHHQTGARPGCGWIHATSQGPGNARNSGPCHRRSEGVGDRRIRRGRGQRGPTEITDHPWTYSVRTGRNGGVYTLA